MTTDDNSSRKASWILGGIAAVEGSWVALNASVSGEKFWHYLGFFAGGAGAWASWLLAALVAAGFVGGAVRLPSVKANLFSFSRLKILGLLVAVSAGIFEEVVFRKWLMDALRQAGWGNGFQVAASAIAFGLVHGVWGLFGRSLRAAVGASVVTGVLGGALAVVYLAGGRSLLPCIAAHFVINALLEPGLVLAATRGEMNRTRNPFRVS